MDLAPPYPIGYLDEENKSIYFPNKCSCSTDFYNCFDNKITEIKTLYESFDMEYSKLHSLVITGKPIRDIQKQISVIRRKWVRAFKNIEAIKSEYVKARIEGFLYKTKIETLEGWIHNKLSTLRPIMMQSENYLIGGRYIDEE